MAGWYIVSQDHCRKFPQTDSLKQQKFVVSQFWRFRSLKPRCQQGHVPFEASMGRSVDSSGGWWQSLTFLVCRYTLQSCLPLAFFSVSMSEFPFSYKDINHWIKTHPNSVWPHLNLIMSTNPYFQIKPLCPVGLRLEHIFWVTQVNLQQWVFLGNRNSTLVPSVYSPKLQSLEAWKTIFFRIPGVRVLPYFVPIRVICAMKLLLPVVAAGKDTCIDRYEIWFCNNFGVLLWIVCFGAAVSWGHQW